jgi:hypothetical protein
MSPYDGEALRWKALQCAAIRSLLFRNEPSSGVAVPRVIKAARFADRPTPRNLLFVQSLHWRPGYNASQWGTHNEA